MGIFGKRTKTKEDVSVETIVEKANKKEVTGTYTRSEIVGLQREAIKDLIKEAVSDVTELIMEDGIDEDTARVYLVLKKYQKPVAKLIDLGYEELYLEIKARWNRIRVESGNSDECRFLVHLMEEIEQNTDD